MSEKKKQSPPSPPRCAYKPCTSDRRQSRYIRKLKDKKESRSLCAGRKVLDYFSLLTPARERPLLCCCAWEDYRSLCSDLDSLLSYNLCRCKDCRRSYIGAWLISVISQRAWGLNFSGGGRRTDTNWRAVCLCAWYQLACTR